MRLKHGDNYTKDELAEAVREKINFHINTVKEYVGKRKVNPSKDKYVIAQNASARSLVYLLFSLGVIDKDEALALVEQIRDRFISSIILTTED